MSLTLTATAECDVCGAYLSSSDEECDHNGNIVTTHVFRELQSNDCITVQATHRHKWQKLADECGSDWISWMYLGTESHVEKEQELYDISNVPIMESPVDARDVSVDEE